MGQPNASSQRGNVVVYLLFSIVVATAVGYGVYLMLRERARAEAASDEAQGERQQVAAVQVPVADSPEESMPVAEVIVAGDPAERDAALPDDIADPAKDTVLLGRPGVDGALEVDKVDRTLKRYLVRYDRCMRRAHEKYPLRRGELRVAFVIAADGSVHGATANATNVEDGLASCVVDVIAKLRFDKPSDHGPAKVVYPMRFVPAPRDDAPDPPAADPWATDPLGNR